MTQQRLIGYGQECVAPGASVQLTRIPQLQGFVVGVLVSEESARNFELVDLRIGNVSCFITAEPIPLAFLAVPDAVLPAMWAVDCAEDEYRELLDVHRPVYIGQRLTLELRNTSDEPRAFKGAVVYRCVD